MSKLTVEQIKAHFDNDVERFSDISKGHQAAVDSTVALELISSAALAVTPDARTLLDVGCGGGNWTVKLLQDRKSVV